MKVLRMCVCVFVCASESERADVGRGLPGWLVEEEHRALLRELERHRYEHSAVSIYCSVLNCSVLNSTVLNMDCQLSVG